MTREKYDKDFNLEAVTMVISQQRPVAAVTRELGIHENTLYKWINQASGTARILFRAAATLVQKMTRYES